MDKPISIPKIKSEDKKANKENIYPSEEAA